jgi:hypothetical protein
MLLLPVSQDRGGRPRPGWQMTRCDYMRRSGPLFTGHMLGGASLGQCERKALPGFVVCAEHVDKAALLLRIRQLERELRRRAKRQA